MIIIMIIIIIIIIIVINAIIYTGEPIRAIKKNCYQKGPVTK